MSYKTIKSWAEDDRPREKFMLKGRVSLSDAELFAIQLGSGNREESAVELAKRILASVQGSLKKLSLLTVEELTQFKGVGEAKAINILSALEIGRRRKATDDKVNLIKSSRDIFEVVYPLLGDLPHEEFWCVYLSKSNKILKTQKISQGSIDSTIVDLRLVLKHAILLSSTAIILAHNHPSESLKPSSADLKLTKKIVESAKIMDISILDHLIIGNNNYYSFADNGVL